MLVCCRRAFSDCAEMHDEVNMLWTSALTLLQQRVQESRKLKSDNLFDLVRLFDTLDDQLRLFGAAWQRATAGAD